MGDLSNQGQGASTKFTDPKFAGQLQATLVNGEQVLDSVDINAEVFTNGAMKSHYGSTVILTDRRLLLFRSGMLGGTKKPFICDLAKLENAAVTRQGNVNVKFEGDYRAPQLWKLMFLNDSVADRWMHLIYGASQRLLGFVPEPQGGTANGIPGSTPADVADAQPHLEEFMANVSSRPHLLTSGSPFGEGLGLEEAMELAFRAFTSPEQARMGGSMVALDLLVGSKPEDLKAAMGVSGFQSSSIPPHLAKTAADLAEAAVAFLDQYDEPGASIWELWLKRDDVAVEFLCWHTVARVRLAAAGRMEAL